MKKHWGFFLAALFWLVAEVWSLANMWFRPVVPSGKGRWIELVQVGGAMSFIYGFLAGIVFLALNLLFGARKRRFSWKLWLVFMAVMITGTLISFAFSYEINCLLWYGEVISRQ